MPTSTSKLDITEENKYSEKENPEKETTVVEAEVAAFVEDTPLPDISLLVKKQVTSNLKFLIDEICNKRETSQTIVDPSYFKDILA